MPTGTPRRAGGRARTSPGPASTSLLGQTAGGPRGRHSASGGRWQRRGGTSPSPPPAAGQGSPPHAFLGRLLPLFLHRTWWRSVCKSPGTAAPAATPCPAGGGQRRRRTGRARMPRPLTGRCELLGCAGCAGLSVEPPRGRKGGVRRE